MWWPLWNAFAILKGKEDKYKNKPLPGAPKGMRHGMTAKGYLTDALWGEDVADWIIDEVDTTRGDKNRWHFLPMDGFGSHQFCWRALKKLWEARIWIPGTPSHTSHIFQMLDTHCFHPVKVVKRRRTRDYKRERGVTQINKWEYPGVAHQCLVEGIKPQTIVNSFKDNSFFPYDPNWVQNNKEKFQLSVLYVKPQSGTDEARAAAEKKFAKYRARSGLQYESDRPVKRRAVERCAGFPLCPSWDQIGFCACYNPVVPTAQEKALWAERASGQSSRCSTVNALLPAGTIATVVPIAERAVDSILLAVEPLPATSNTKGGKRPLNKYGERSAEPRHWNKPTRTDGLQELESATTDVAEKKE